MKVISEYKLSQDQIKEYRNKGYEVYYGYENPKIKRGESVGILLDTMYTTTIELIDNLLHRKTKSKITIKYKDKTYVISSPDEWQKKWYENHRWYRENHPILDEYYSKRSEYFERKQLESAKEHMNYVLDYFNQGIPEDLDIILSNFAKLYDIDVDYDSLESKLLAYASIKYYLDNDIEYSRDILGHMPDEEPIFECVSFGDETYLEDMIYKNSEVC